MEHEKKVKGGKRGREERGEKRGMHGNKTDGWKE